LVLADPDQPTPLTVGETNETVTAEEPNRLLWVGAGGAALLVVFGGAMLLLTLSRPRSDTLLP
jgi:hypothetical protein